MIDSISIGGKCPPTVLTNIGSLASVSSDVMAKTSPLRKFALTVGIWACIRLDPHVNIPVAREGGLRVEGFLAVIKCALQK